MKFKSLFVLIILAIASFKTAQEITISSNQNQSAEYFEGIIKYKYLMDDVSKLSDEQIEEKIKQSEAMFGRHMSFYIKEPRMKTVLTGQFMKMTSYYDGTDSFYTHAPDFNELYKSSTYDDWSFQYDTIITTKNAKMINGAACDLLTFKSDSYEWNYYYNDQLKVNVENYKHYKSWFWNKAIEICHSLPIRFEGKIPGTYIFIEAEEIIEQPVDDSEFDLPKL